MVEVVALVRVRAPSQLAAEAIALDVIDEHTDTCSVEMAESFSHTKDDKEGA